MNESINISFDEALNNFDGLFFWQVDTAVSDSEIYYSESVLKVTGYQGNEIKELERGWESLIIKDDLPLYKKNLDHFESDQDKNVLKLEYRITKSSGETVKISERINVTRSSEGKILKRFGFVLDVSDYSSEIEQLKNRIFELEQLNSSKDNFISILSHDLRAPFTSILGFSDVLLQENNLSEKEKVEYLKYIHDSSHNQLQLINYLLDWSRLQTGRLKIDMQRIHAQSVVYNCVSALTGMAIRKNVNIKVEVPDTLYIDADERLISQVLKNLISNAVKYSNEEDNILVKAGIFNDEMCEFIVKDEGGGISDVNRDKLFNIGKIFSTEGTKGEKGTGLGLALAKQIINKHKGEIWFYSNEGEGSEFHFTVPSSESSILLVLTSDDEREVFSQIISKHFSSFNILSAQNGFEALGIISAKMPSLVISDHNLPLMDGRQFVQSVRKENKNLRIHFIVLINSEADDITKTYQEIGVKTLKKISFDAEQLKEKVESLLFS
ncbi:MAG: PAS domain-containing protein [Ignavibacteria bacterium]|nr:PAS domain-containing protein [Ignavibacteria bacterium]MBT8381296.1 PAS domain-containing protein [Ignavibacteria bacterium]MBT8390774.1 PAS domain-containing protein [Ignavibacteria bacterium]NNJ51989.1 PAS domain-containing protein [Ignavibacteriaceae bacterium]NNL20146.1 PAS domain-containing protein [Ignavibacteriaceae bacterium]